MRKFCGLTVVMCGVLVAGLFVMTRHAEARPDYYKLWRTTYPAVDKANKVNAEVKCNVCHVGTNKKKRNAYGKAIQDALGGTNLKAKDKAKIVDAFKKAEKVDSETSGKTFGDLLQANELPVKTP